MQPGHRALPETVAFQIPDLMEIRCRLGNGHFAVNCHGETAAIASIWSVDPSPSGIVWTLQYMSILGEKRSEKTTFNYCSKIYLTGILEFPSWKCRCWAMRYDCLSLGYRDRRSWPWPSFLYEGFWLWLFLGDRAMLVPWVGGQIQIRFSNCSGRLPLFDSVGQSVKHWALALGRKNKGGEKWSPDLLCQGNLLMEVQIRCCELGLTCSGGPLRGHNPESSG